MPKCFLNQSTMLPLLNLNMPKYVQCLVCMDDWVYRTILLNCMSQDLVELCVCHMIFLNRMCMHTKNIPRQIEIP